MISLRLFLLLLVTLGCRAWGDDQPPVLLGAAIAAALGVPLGFGLLFKASAIGLLASLDGSGHKVCWQRLHKIRHRVEVGWVMTLPAALLATGWGAWLNAFELAGVPQSLTLLGWFLPSLLFIVLVEWTAAQFDALGNVSGGETLSWGERWLARLRLGELASMLTCLAPILLIALLTDLAELCLGERLTSVQIACATLASLTIVLLFFPLWLGNWMGVRRLPAGPLRERIEHLQQVVGIHGLEPMLLPSRGCWAGAAIVGWFPRFRKLWLGDALIERLSERQLDMVILHELAHVSRRHFYWRASPILWALAAVGLCCAIWPEGEPWEAGRNMTASLLAGLILLLGLGSMARACELDADRTACLLAERVSPWASGNRPLAAMELGGALSALLQDAPAGAGRSWLHPSLARRLAELHPRRIRCNC
ncbi:MAG: M48 family metalloprotease [Planctomycetales bacterium]|nr:M48 family metalloprotease [Planctomycetales bacterium]